MPTGTPTPSSHGALVSSPATAGNIGTSGAHLTLGGQPYRFVGVNAYELGTDWGVNAGCGAMLTDSELDGFFASLRPNSVVRIWMLQGSMASNIHTHQLDWGPLDRVFAAAASHGQRLIASLAGQGGTCDNAHWQDPSWFAGGFKDVFNDPPTTDGRGLTPLSYWDYVQAAVAHFKTSPALGMWEPISEPEASTCPEQFEPLECSGHQTCPDEASAAQALRYFFDIVGAEIHSLDPDHLVEDGMLAGGQCGTSGSDFSYVSASPGIDVLSYHDYYPGNEPMGGDRWNGLAVRLGLAAALGKPIIGGEVGLEAGSGGGCLTVAERGGDDVAKAEAQLTAGSSGVLFWDWVPTATDTCSYDIAPDDPLLAALRDVALGT